MCGGLFGVFFGGSPSGSPGAEPRSGCGGTQTRGRNSSHCPRRGPNTLGCAPRTFASSSGADDYGTQECGTATSARWPWSTFGAGPVMTGGAMPSPPSSNTLTVFGIAPRIMTSMADGAPKGGTPPACPTHPRTDPRESFRTALDVMCPSRWAYMFPGFIMVGHVGNARARTAAMASSVTSRATWCPAPVVPRWWLLSGTASDGGTTWNDKSVKRPRPAPRQDPPHKGSPRSLSFGLPQSDRGTRGGLGRKHLTITRR